MALDPTTKAAIEAAVTPIATMATTTMLTAALKQGIKMLSTTNYKNSNLTGDTNMKPSEKNVAISKAETAASEAEGKLAKDGVSAQDGNIKAAETEAKASTGEATAAEAGAQAVRTKAGASDIEVKALKIT